MSNDNAASPPIVIEDRQQISHMRFQPKRRWQLVVHATSTKIGREYGVIAVQRIADRRPREMRNAKP